MSKKAQHEPPADDWAGLAQNLFGIDLAKSGGDDDLLDEDMFKVELPPPAEPTPPVATAVATTAEVVPAEVPQAPAAAPVAVTKPKVATPKKSAAVKASAEDDPFGAGILDEVAATSEVESSDEGLTLPEDFDDEGLTLASDYDDGLTLSPDHEADGLTLPSDYDDGLTLPPEGVASDDAVASDDEASEATSEGRAERPRRRGPRRTREDAYWDMLENWEWEEIPEDDSPREGGDRSRFRSGDRDRRGRGGDRGGRDRGGREDRPRTSERGSSEDRPRREERRPSETTSAAPQGESSARPRRGDRPREDRSPRREQRRDRDERRDEPRQTPASSSTIPSNVADDFGSGIFEEQSPSQQTSTVPTPARPPREEVVAQSSQAADAVLREPSRSTSQSVSDDLVWPDDDSDVRPAPTGSVVETTGLPAADAAGESDRMVQASDVEPLEEYEERPRRPRRRRRRPMSERTAPPDGNEGTTFDLSEALTGEGETPDFIPSASADDSSVSTEAAGEEAEDVSSEDRPSDRRGGRRRRRRRYRPDEDANRDVEANADVEAGAESEAAEPTDAIEDGEPVLKPIAYSNIPSWEEAIRYLLEPHRVGRNLGPDDDDEGLASDPRGSGGAEPTPPPPPRRRRGGSRGRRPDRER